MINLSTSLTWYLHLLRVDDFVSNLVDIWIKFKNTFENWFFLCPSKTQQAYKIVWYDQRKIFLQCINGAIYVKCHNYIANFEIGSEGDQAIFHFTSLSGPCRLDYADCVTLLLLCCTLFNWSVEILGTRDLRARESRSFLYAEV